MKPQSFSETSQLLQKNFTMSMASPQSDSGVENKNVSFLNTKVFWIFYILLILSIRTFLLVMPGVPSEYATSVTHIIHSIVGIPLEAVFSPILGNLSHAPLEQGFSCYGRCYWWPIRPTHILGANRWRSPIYPEQKAFHSYSCPALPLGIL